MILYTLKILLKERKRFIGIIIEQTFVFILLMICILSIVKAIVRYNEPGQLNTQQVLSYGYSLSNLNDGVLAEKASDMLDVLTANLRKKDYIVAITNSSNFAPYMRQESYYLNDTITINNKRNRVFIKGSDQDGLKVFKPVMEEGNWLGREARLENGNISAIVTRKLIEDTGLENPLGKIIKYRNENFQITGIIAGIKHDIFSDAVPAIIMNDQLMDQMALNNLSGYREICVRIQPGYEKEFNRDFHNEFKRLISDENIFANLLSLQSAKSIYILPTLITTSIKIVPTLFLFIFAFIGTFGIVWLNSRKRVKELALRLAIGSTKNNLIFLLVIENIIITFTALIPGILLFLISYDFTFVNIMSMSITLFLMILFSVFSAWLPAYLITRQNLSDVLRYE